MAESGQVSGIVILRPVRLGLVFKPTIDSLRRAVESATSTWGGMYYAFLSPDNADESLSLARRLGVDALWPMDEDFLSQRLCNSEGYHWFGFGGPFEYSTGTLDTGLLDAGWLLDDSSVERFVLPCWSDEDLLRDLFAVWFGAYEGSEHSQGVNAAFAQRAEKLTIDPAGPIPGITGALSPIDLTALEIEYRGLEASCGVLVLDPQNPRDLLQFWNLRATGNLVFPWPKGFEGRVQAAGDTWLQQALANNRLHTPQSGSGIKLGPFVDVWLGEGQSDTPRELTSMLERHGIGAHPGMLEQPTGWTGHHPLATSLSRTFTSPVDPGEHAFSVALPLFWPSLGRRGRRSGVLAAQLSGLSGANLGPRWTANIPNVRDLSTLLRGYWNVGEPFQYPTHDGLALGVSAASDSVTLGLVPSFSIFERLLRDSGWKCSQSDDGRFATQLVELLGGAGSDAANQPAVRAVLRKAARSQHGLHIQALVQVASDNKGNWPSALLAISPADYPARVVNYLLFRKMLHPVLPVKCPNCATTSPLRPDDLATELRCPMCSEPFPLGFAFGAAAKRPDWRYRLAANVPDERLSGALPVMAVLNVLSSFGSLSSRSAPHVLGLQIDGSDISCEVDVALATNDGGTAAVIMGEVKSYGVPIDSNDLANLRKVQQFLRTKNVNCYVLAATLRESLSPEEIADLRAFCEGSGTILARYSLEPLLPIVLTGNDLSVPQYTDEHPGRWTRAGWGIANIALESCKRNLGLADIRHEPVPGKEAAWRLSWND
jgi:hypothetical protein